MPVGFAQFSIPTTIAGFAELAAPGYGHDLSCTTDLDPSMVEVDGVTCLAQALFRRITTPRGTLIDDPNYGIDLTAYLNDDLSPSDLGRIGSTVDAEFLKDERVLRSTSTVTFIASNVLTVASLVTPNGGPSFQLVITTSQVTTQLLIVPT